MVPFMLSGLERGEKCIYVVDINTAQEIKKIFSGAGVDLAEAERKGQFVILHERDTYTREGFFDPDLMIRLLASETDQALRQGYPPAGDRRDELGFARLYRFREAAGIRGKTKPTFSRIIPVLRLPI